MRGYKSRHQDLDIPRLDILSLLFGKWFERTAALAASNRVWLIKDLPRE